MATSGFLVEVEKVNLDELRKQYPEAFNRKYHSKAGLVTDSFTFETRQIRHVASVITLTSSSPLKGETFILVIPSKPE